MEREQRTGTIRKGPESDGKRRKVLGIFSRSQCCKCYDDDMKAGDVRRCVWRNIHFGKGCSGVVLEWSRMMT